MRVSCIYLAAEWEVATETNAIAEKDNYIGEVDNQPNHGQVSDDCCELTLEGWPFVTNNLDNSRRNEEFEALGERKQKKQIATSHNGYQLKCSAANSHIFHTVKDDCNEHNRLLQSVRHNGAGDDDDDDGEEVDAMEL